MEQILLTQALKADFCLVIHTQLYVITPNRYERDQILLNFRITTLNRGVLPSSVSV